jgi:hypothetical protein
VSELESTLFGALSFEESVRLFKSWGLIVEPGPRPEEVTLILEGPDYRTTSVHPACMLPEMAAAALRVRWFNGTILDPSHRPQQKGEPRAALKMHC